MIILAENYMAMTQHVYITSQTSKDFLEDFAENFTLKAIFFLITTE